MDLQKKVLDIYTFASQEERVIEQVLRLGHPLQVYPYLSMRLSRALAALIVEHDLAFEAMKKIYQTLVNQRDQVVKDPFVTFLISHHLAVLEKILNGKEAILSLAGLMCKDLHPRALLAVAATCFKEAEKLTTEDLRLALLLTLFYPLRQTVGSCFATSMVIILQKENPKVFLQELVQLISSGALIRVIEGQTFTVPFNMFLQPDTLPFDAKTVALMQDTLLNQGLGPLKFSDFLPPYLLKSFEYTLASMTEFRLYSHAGNLSIALGIDPNEKEGLLAQIKEVVDLAIREKQQEVEKAHIEAQTALDYVNMSQSLLRQVSSHERASAIQAQGMSYESHLNAMIAIRDDLNQELEELQNFLAVWVEQIREAMKHFFQETYDPNLKTDQLTFEDSPAGFRLLCKHGRQQVKAWTLITSDKEYRQALIEFFDYFERSGKEIFKTKGAQNILFQATMACRDIASDEKFIERALIRLKKQPGPFTFLTPYSYLSGGTLQTLLACFTAKPRFIKSLKLHVKDPLELLVKLIDWMKDSPARFQEKFIKNNDKGLLIQSESHAFIFKPGLNNFKYFWNHSTFSYTVIRDDFIEPIENFYKTFLWDLSHQIAFYEAFNRHFKLSVFNECVKQLDTQSFIGSFIEKTKINPAEVVGFALLFLKENIKECPKILWLEFADTNWPYFNFCFAMNPLTHQLEIFRISFDHQLLLPMTEWEDQFSNKNGWIIFGELLDELTFSSIEMVKLFHKA
jgi:hypothetical protein